MRELLRVVEAPRTCSYLPSEVASLEYRIIPELDRESYARMLARGYRRFGIQYFRPACRDCRRCRSIRVRVADFEEGRRYRRVLRLNRDVHAVVRAPELTRTHLELYQRYHRFMAHHRDWPRHDGRAQSYAQAFLVGGEGFAREVAYYRAGELVGCAFMDDVGDAASLVYFYYAPEWRAASPGVFSILTQIQYARARGYPYVYLGYWIPENRSMSYKSQYRPHELLVSYPRDGEEPVWREPADDVEASREPLFSAHERNLP
ncbi:MAG: arginyltransferase [bacterium]